MNEQTKLALIMPFRARTNRYVRELTDRIRLDQPLPHVVRFGDGEIFCCLDQSRLATFAENIDQHPYTVDLAKALLEALRTFVASPGLWLGNWHYWPFAPWLHGLVDSLGGQDLWCSHNLFAHIRQKALEPVRDLYLAIRKSPRRKLLVGRLELKQLKGFFGDAVHVPTPALNGWNEYHNVLVRLRAVVRPRDIVLVAFGMPAKPLIAAMLLDQARMLLDQPEATYFDVGAGMDCMVQGRKSRSCQPTFCQTNDLYSGLLTR